LIPTISPLDVLIPFFDPASAHREIVIPSANLLFLLYFIPIPAGPIAGGGSLEAKTYRFWARMSAVDRLQRMIQIWYK